MTSDKFLESYYKLEEEVLRLRKDEALLDFLENLNAQKRYTGQCVLQWSNTGRGWRLHETDDVNSSNTVREAIRKFKEELGESEVQNVNTNSND